MLVASTTIHHWKIACFVVKNPDFWCFHSGLKKRGVSLRKNAEISHCLQSWPWLLVTKLVISVGFWLVVSTTLKNDGVRQLGWWNSQYMESHKLVIKFHGSKPPTRIIHDVNGGSSVLLTGRTGTTRAITARSELRRASTPTSCYGGRPPPGAAGNHARVLNLEPQQGWKTAYLLEENKQTQRNGSGNLIEVIVILKDWDK